MPREGNDPRRRIAEAAAFTLEERRQLAGRAKYIGSGYHKRFPAVYQFDPTTGPRPSKSLCDGKRVVPKEEAAQLLRNGVLRGMFSEPFIQGYPKYIWSVDEKGEVYEAKTHPNDHGQYHGYRLEDHDPMRRRILNAWQERAK